MPRPPDPAVRLKRLEALADLWGKVYLFHPAIVTPSPHPSPSGRGKRGEGAELDWNQALIRTIPRVEAAESPEELANAINEELLAQLDDPLTYAYVRREEGGGRREERTSGLEARQLPDSIGYLRIPSSEEGLSRPFLGDFQAAVEALATAETLVVDMRWFGAGGVPSDVAVMLRFFVRAGLLTGPVQRRVHQGWNEDNGPNAYKQEWRVIAGTWLTPIQQVDWLWARSLYGVDFRQSQTITKPTVFLVNRPSAVGTYKILEALRSQGGIAVVYEPSGPAGAFPEFRQEYPEGLGVQLNTERLIGHEGQTGFRPDITVAEPITEAQLAAIAKEALTARTRDQGLGTRGQGASLMNLRPPAPMSERKESLSREERLLGLFKVWNVVRFLDPHLDLCDMDWHSCLPEWIPRVEAADSLVAFARSLRMLTAHLHDNNVFYLFPNMPEPQALPVVFGWVEGKIVVTDVLGSGRTVGQGPSRPSQKPEARSQKSEVETDGGLGSTRPGADTGTPEPQNPRTPEDSTAVSGQPSAASPLGLEVGDELVELDGKTTSDLVAEHRLQIPYSTEDSFYQRMCDMLVLGPAGSEVKLVVHRKTGTVLGENGDAPKMGTVPGSRTGPCEGTVPILHITLTLKRTMRREVWVAQSSHAHEPQGHRVLSGNLGYLNLCRLPNLAEFERAFEALSRTDGLIVDIRGYPRFMVQLVLSARLNDRPVKSAIFEIPVVSSYDRTEQGWNIGQYEIKPDPRTHYGGPVIVLINEKTRGTAEDLGIYLKDAKRVTFVGGPTAGCNGNRTWLSLPGAGRMFFTGMRVKFGDGSRFQNVGITPDVPVAPTIEGVRAGKDEVLETGIGVLRRLVQRPSSSAPAQTKDELTRDKGPKDKGRRGP
jgi:C-terminal processing protease CtpA/Prc